jgi:hypothetical protein
MHDKILIQILCKGKQFEDLMKRFSRLNLKKLHIINKKGINTLFVNQSPAIIERLNYFELADCLLKTSAITAFISFSGL